MLINSNRTINIFFYLKFCFSICDSSQSIVKEMETIEGDKVYYKQLVQSLLENLHRSISFGELGSVDSGNFFLCRHEDRIMWIQVLKNIKFKKSEPVILFKEINHIKIFF